MRWIGEFNKLRVIGVPTNSSGGRGGVFRGPMALRQAGLTEKLCVSSPDVQDVGDVVFFQDPLPQRDAESGIIAPNSLKNMILSTESAVMKSWKANSFPLVIGGDCPLLLGCLAAAKKRFGRSGLLFLDGHEDADPPHQSPTGESADMELGFATGLTHPGVDLGIHLPLVHPLDVVVLGARDASLLKKTGILSVSQQIWMIPDSQIQPANALHLTREVLDKIRQQAPYWWLHLDLDVLSTVALPAVDYPQPGGLDWQTLTLLVQEALRTEGLLGWNITIYNPDLDPQRELAKRIVEFVSEVISSC